MTKLYVLQSTRGNETVWNVGRGWSAERPDAFEFGSFADAAETAQAVRRAAPYDDTAIKAEVVEEERED